MGLHSQIWRPVWTLDTINAMLDERRWRDDAPVTVENNLLHFHPGQYEEEAIYCGNYMRNYISREFWVGARWEPYPTEELLQGITSFEWYDGGCTAPGTCFGTSDARLHVAMQHDVKPDEHALKVYFVARKYYDLWRESGLSLHTALTRVAETEPDTQAWLDNVWQVNEAEALEFWRKENPQCPISPTSWLGQEEPPLTLSTR